MRAVLIQGFGKLETFVFRPLFIFVTFVLILFAIVQASGRIALGALRHFENEINRVSETFGVSLSGVEGGWLGLNPVVTIRSLELPGATASGVQLELDILESIARSGIVARRLSVERGDLHFERHEGGWRLRGFESQESSFDTIKFLRNSDELSALVNLVFHPEGEPSVDEPAASFVVEARAINRGGRHLLTASVVNSDADGAGLELSFREREAVPGVRPSERFLTLAGELYVPKLLTGMTSLSLKLTDGAWRADGDVGVGGVGATLSGLSPPEGDVRLALDTLVRVAQSGDRWDVVAQDLSISDGQDVLAFNPVRMSYAGEDEGPALDLTSVLGLEEPAHPQFRLWVDELDLSEVSRFATDAIGDWEPVGRWIRALNVGGRATNVHLFFDPERGFGYLASLSGIAMDAYKGAPTVRNVQGSAWGYERGFAIQLNASDIDIKFPDLYNPTWRMNHVQGFVKGWFGPGYFALQGSHLKAVLPEASVAAGFALTRPDPTYDQRLSLFLNADALDLNAGRTFIPYKIPEELAEWLAKGPRTASLSDIHFAYHGQVHLRPDELGRRIELKANVDDGVVQYDERWPLVSNLSGSIHAAGVETRVAVASATTLGAQLVDTNVALMDNAAYAKIALSAIIEDDEGFDFIRSSPLRQDMSFVEDDWTGRGALDVRGDLIIPIKEDEAPNLAVELEFDARGFGISMPGYRVEADDLAGRGTFGLPSDFNGQFTGALFGAPATFVARSDPGWLRFAIEGSAAEPDVYRLIEFDDIGLMQGRFGFDATVNIALNDTDVTYLELESDLVGLAVNLPGHLKKPHLESAATEVDVQFLSDYQSVRWLYKDTNGWVHADDSILRGAIGIGTAPPMTEQSESAIAIRGNLKEARLSDWVSGEGGAAISLPLDWQIDNLSIDKLWVDELSFDAVRLKGEQRGADVWFGFASPDLTGEVRLPADRLMTIDLDHVRIPASEPSDAMVKGVSIALDEDPITVDVGYALPVAEVNVKRLDLGEEPFGAWRFVIDREDDVVVFDEFRADVNGVHIADSRVTWDLIRNRSSFAGSITLDDLQETLPKWDYAPSVQTELAALVVNASWAGSPTNVGLIGLKGDVTFIGENGRFRQMQTAQGGLRILSLLNLSTILGRIGGDFSDVSGSGITFKSIKADVYLNEGLLEFRDRMVIDSTSSNFEMGGRVNLLSGVLDNEMIVTLPISESLPWYGAYLALANPLLGLGVLVGERVLRKPIQQLSSAKFKVTGTLDEPEVSWVSIWDKSMSNQSNDAEPSDQPPAGLVESGRGGR